MGLRSTLSHSGKATADVDGGGSHSEGFRSGIPPLLPLQNHFGDLETPAESSSVEEQFRFHDLRVSFCTNLVASGVEAPQLKQLARHRSIETTMKYYRGRTVEADRKALDRMEAAFSVMENVAQEMKEVENNLVNAFSTSKMETT